MLHDLRSPICPGCDFAVVPGGDDVLLSEVTEVIIQFLAQHLILMGVGDEDLVCHDMLLFVLMGPTRADKSAPTSAWLFGPFYHICRGCCFAARSKNKNALACQSGSQGEHCHTEQNEAS